MHSASALPGVEHVAQQRAPLPLSAVALGFAGMLTVMGSRAAFAVTYPVMVVEQGWSVAEITGAFSAGLLIFAPVAVGIGYLTDRAGCKFTMLLGSVALAAGMLMVAASTELWHLYIAYILANGLGSGAVGFVTVVKALSIRAPRRFAAAFGLASMGQGVGALVLSPAIQGVIETWGWRGGPLVIAGIVVCFLLPLVVLFAPGREFASGAHSHGHGGEGPRVLSWLFLIFFLANLGLGYQMLIPTHNVAHIQEVGFAPSASAWAAGWWGAITAVGAMVGGILLERLGVRRQLAFAVVLFSIGTTALVTSQPEMAWLLLVYIVLGGFGRGMLGTSVAASQTRAFAGPRLGRFTGLLELAFGTGAFLGPWLTAIVHDTGWGYSPGLLSAIFMACLGAAMTVIGSALTRRAERHA